MTALFISTTVVLWPEFWILLVRATERLPWSGHSPSELAHRRNDAAMRLRELEREEAHTWPGLEGYNPDREPDREKVHQLVGLARDIQWWPAPLWRVGQRHRTFPLLYGRSVRLIVVHIRPPGAYFAVLPANVVELGYQLGAIAEGHDAAIDQGPRRSGSAMTAWCCNATPAG